MAFAQGSRTGLSYIVESTFGTTPATPTMLPIPYTSHSLDFSKTRVQGNDLLGDRIPRVDRHGNRIVGGDISADLRIGDFDDLLESAFFNTIDSNGELIAGVTPQYLTIEDRALDITQYRRFTGCAVSNMSVSVRPDQMATANFTVVGKDMTQSGTIVSGATYSAASGNEPFDSYSGSISDGGSAIAIVTGIDFSIDNGLNPTMVIGADATPQLEYGRAVVEGTVTVYYETAALINKFINETASTLTLVLNDATSGGTHTYDFPNIKYNGASVPVDGTGSRIVTLPFVALYDATVGSNIKLSIA